MKKTAVLIYNSFCNFEFSVALEILALAEKEVVIFAHTKEAVKSEDGLMVLPNQTISEINIDEYDSLILPGAMDIREAIENEEVIEFIRKFENKAIGAISIAPLMLVKAGLLSGKPFMAGVNKEEIMKAPVGLSNDRTVLRQQDGGVSLRQVPVFETEKSHLRRQSTMKKAIIMMIVVFALVVWPFSGVWQLLSGIIGGGVRESFIYPIYGGIILLSGIIVVCTELILEEIKSLKDDIKDKKEGC